MRFKSKGESIPRVIDFRASLQKHGGNASGGQEAGGRSSRHLRSLSNNVSISSYMQSKESLTRAVLDLEVALLAAEAIALLMEAALELTAPAWLDKALDAAAPVRVLNTVDEPMVERIVEPSDTMVEMTGTVVMADKAGPVAPGTPPTPKIVVAPVKVSVVDPEVTTVLKVEVVTAVAVVPY